tara:strand:- start:598 stop:903 length:306 start_codon:yes stop_codon:yes gene_type:complete
MKKQLTEEQFKRACLELDIGAQTKVIAHGVLVEQLPQKHFSESLGISKGAVSQAVKRVWEAHQQTTLPMGFMRVSAILPEHQAYQVQQWSEVAKKKLGKEK